MDKTSEQPQNYAWNITEAETQRYLALAQAATVQALIPTLTFLILTAVVGAVGNSLVLFVYYRGFSTTTTRIFLLYAAAVDLFSCLFVIPGDVIYMFNMWTWTNVDLCRLKMFMMSFTGYASASALVMLAVVRYRKVCHPHGWQVSRRHAKVSALVLLFVSILISAVFSTVYGDGSRPIPDAYTRDAQLEQMRAAADYDGQSSKASDSLTSLEIMKIVDAIRLGLQDAGTITQTVTDISPPQKTMADATVTATARPRGRLIIYGHECTIDDKYKGTIWPAVTSSALFLTMVAMMISVCTLYFLIGRKACKHRRPFHVQHPTSDKPKVKNNDHELGGKNAKETNGVRERPLSMKIIDEPKRLDRTTVMLFVISMIYIAGYIVLFCALYFRTFAPKQFSALSLKENSAWHFFVRLFYINCASNPIVYSFLDRNFRKAWTNLFCRRK